MPFNKVRRWLAETHNGLFELLRHFFSRRLTDDIISSDQIRMMVITALGIVAAIGPMIVRLYMPKYGYLRSLPAPRVYLAAVHADRLFFVSLSMLVAGLMTSLLWQSLFPTRRDYLILRPLPLRLSHIFAARFISSFVILLFVVADLNIPASLLFPMLASGRWQSPPFGVQYVLAHAVVTIAAGMFTFFVMVAIQGACLNLLPARRFDQISVLLQALFFTAFAASIPYVFDMPKWYKLLDAKPHWLLLFPPAWFWGLYERLLGTQDLYFLQLAHRSILGLEAMLVLSLATYLVTYCRHAAGALEQSSKITHLRPRRILQAASWLLGCFAGTTYERAVLAFAILTLTRSRRHRLILGVCAGISLVLALHNAAPIVIAHFHMNQPWGRWQHQSILAMPLIVGTLAVSALCYVFLIPVELQANWIFRMAVRAEGSNMLESVESLLLLFGLVPAILLTLPFEAFAQGWAFGLAHCAFSATLILLFIEFQLREWRKIPFTCSYVPGRRNPWHTIWGYLFLFAFLIPIITYIEARYLYTALLWTITAVSILCWVVIRAARRKQLKDIYLLFDESEEPLIRSVQLITD
jgi:hypothetical protein